MAGIGIRLISSVLDFNLNQTNRIMKSTNLQKITPYLWFESNGLEAAEYYTSIFPDSRIVNEAPMVTTFQLCGQVFSILAAGPHDEFNDSILFFIDCKDQEEVDYYWNRFIADGGKESMCGWLQDKYGVRWQIIPEKLMKLSHDPDPIKSKKMFDAMMKMKKIIVQDLETAYNS